MINRVDRNYLYQFCRFCIKASWTITNAKNAPFEICLWDWTFLYIHQMSAQRNHFSSLITMAYSPRFTLASCPKRIILFYTQSSRRSVNYRLTKRFLSFLPVSLLTFATRLEAAFSRRIRLITWDCFNSQRHGSSLLVPLLLQIHGSSKLVAMSSQFQTLASLPVAANPTNHYLWRSSTAHIP